MSDPEWSVAECRGTERSAGTDTGAAYDEDDPNGKEDDNLRSTRRANSLYPLPLKIDTDWIVDVWIGVLLCGGRTRNALFPRGVSA